MEEREFRETYEEVNSLPCVFERAILARCAACVQAQKRYLAEREAVGCRSTDAHLDCRTLLDMLQQNARFALRQPQVDQPLPHTKEIRVECGGLHGLAQLLGEAGEPAGTDDVRAMVLAARRRFNTLRQLPLAKLIQGIAQYRTRRRGRRGRD